jgi:hypothetical protein
MSSEPPTNSVPPVEPPPPSAVTPPAPPIVDPYAAPPAYAPAAYAPGYYAPQPPKGLAIASLITGIAGVFFSLFDGLGFLPSLAGVITGHLARKRQPYARGMWLAGMICGYIGLGISLIWIIVLIVIVVVAISAGVAGGLDSSY